MYKADNPDIQGYVVVSQTCHWQCINETLLGQLSFVGDAKEEAMLVAREKEKAQENERK